MLPRRSMVLRYLSLISFSVLALLLWMTGPGGSDSVILRLLHGPLNETALRLEFLRLQQELNVTYSAENKTVEELYGFVQMMRSRVPVNPHKFTYLINPTGICAGQDIFLLTYVHTAPGHYKRRMAIRETWGHPKHLAAVGLHHRVVFLTGYSKESALQDALQMESDMYGDIIQEDYLDSYRNLTYKAVQGLKWITLHCSHARFILKTDDDIFVNIFQLLGHLQRESQIADGLAPKRLLMCLVWYHMKVVRDPKSKWYIPRSEYPSDFFPTYCSGSAFVFTPDVARDMYNASLFTPFFWVDDFYVTGLLAKKVGVQQKKLNSVYVLGPSVFLQRFTEEEKWRTLVFGHVHNLNHVFQVWKRIMREQEQSHRLQGAVQPASEGGVQPATQGGVQPAAPRGVQPAAQGVGQPVAERGVQPAVQGGVQPAAQGGVQPVAQVGVQPAAQVGVQPAAQGGIQPAAQGGAQHVRNS